MAKTLEELKAENAKAEAEDSTNPQVVDDEAEAEAAEVAFEESGEVAEPANDESEETDVEAWMQTEEQTSDSGESVPVAKHAQMRQKLKGTIREQESEIDQLKKQIEELRTGAVQASAKVDNSELPPRPKLEDYDYDDDQYNAALDAWHDARLDARLQLTQQTAAQKTQAEQAQMQVSAKVDSHYERAEKLIAQAGISPDLYRDADTSVRKAIDSVMPGKGDMTADYMISVLGEGSEKVMYYLGRNATARAELQSRLIGDPSGLSAMAYLGQVSARVTSPAKKTSTAPPPAPSANGDANGSVGDKAWLKKYKAAQGDPQKSFDIRREAKRAGVDVTRW